MPVGPCFSSIFAADMAGYKVLAFVLHLHESLATVFDDAHLFNGVRCDVVSVGQSWEGYYAATSISTAPMKS